MHVHSLFRRRQCSIRSPTNQAVWRSDRDFPRLTPAVIEQIHHALHLKKERFAVNSRLSFRLKQHQKGNGNAPDHWGCGIYGYSSYRCASGRPGLSLLSARPAMGLPGQLSIHELLAMPSHSFRDRCILWFKPAYCLWMAAAASASSSGVIRKARLRC